MELGQFELSRVQQCAGRAVPWICPLQDSKIPTLQEHCDVLKRFQKTYSVMVETMSPAQVWNPCMQAGIVARNEKNP